MSDNRFEFLELEEAPPPSAQSAPAEIVSSQMPAPLLDANGTALAHVRVVDPRGYFAFIEHSLQEDLAQTYRIGGGGDTHAVITLHVIEHFGMRGIRAGQFNYPAGIAVDSQGVLFVADSYNHRIQRITPSRDVAVIGRRGHARGEFLSPQSVATDSHDAFYIVEQGNHRVQKYSGDGVLELAFGRRGYKEGEFNAPTDIVVSAAGDIYVADTGNSRVQRFNSDGRFLAGIGPAQGAQPALVSPQALAVDTADNLYIADTFAHRVYKFDPLGRFVAQFGSAARSRRSEKSAAQIFREPRALAVDPSGLIYVADCSESALLGTDAPGRLLVMNGNDGEIISRVESLGRGLKSLSRPGGLAIGREGIYDTLRKHVLDHLYLADTMNHRILHLAWSEDEHP